VTTSDFYGIIILRVPSFLFPMTYDIGVCSPWVHYILFFDFLPLVILSYYKLFLHFNLCLSVMLDSFSCSFISIIFLTTSWSFTLMTQIKVRDQLIVRKDMDVNEHEWLSNITLKTQIIKEQLIVRKDMDVNEHEWLSNITLRHKL
jgi:hypothetical protein